MADSKEFSIGSDRVVTPEGVRPGVMVVRGGQIKGVLERASLKADIDIGNKMLLPGLIDPHVHINEPGRTEWEGFATGTRAAAAGGFTTLIDMPLNCLPETTTVEALELKRRSAAGQCVVDYGFWGGVVADNQAHVEPLAEAGVLGF